jgi:beta-phosphoglucomutase
VAAFLFDLDGTLIDSMPHHHTAWARWHARRGNVIDTTDYFAATAGRTNDEILADMYPALAPAERRAMADEKEAIYREIAASLLCLIAGAEAFAAAARAAGVRMAVCTASTPENIALAYRLFPIGGWVETTVSPADRASGPSPGRRPGDGLRGKPEPDIFLEAARRLAVAPADCIVFEDAPLGVEGARRAGMRAVALTTTLPASAFDGHANVIARAPDFTRLDLSSLLAKEPRHA